MKALDLLADTAQVTEILPGKWHIKTDDLPLFALVQDPYWLTFSALLPKGQLVALQQLTIDYAGIKMALTPACGHEFVEIRAEMPLDRAVQHNHTWRWAEALLAKFLTALEAASAPGNVRAENPTRLQTQPGDMADMLEAVADLGEPVSQPEPNSIEMQIPVGGRVRTIQVERRDAWYRLTLEPGTGNLLHLVEPITSALRDHLLRVSASVRFCRAEAGAVDGDDGIILRFLVDVPQPVTTASLSHALQALATMAEQFEFEIETLATEAILAHAYVVLSSGAQSTATPHSLSPED